MEIVRRVYIPRTVRNYRVSMELVVQLQFVARPRRVSSSIYWRTQRMQSLVGEIFRRSDGEHGLPG